MKGMATVRLLRELERHTGRRIWELFDLIGEEKAGGLSMTMFVRASHLPVALCRAPTPQALPRSGHQHRRPAGGGAGPAEAGHGCVRPHLQGEAGPLAPPCCSCGCRGACLWAQECLPSWRPLAGHARPRLLPSLPRLPGAGPQGVLARGGLQGQQGGELDGGGRRSRGTRACHACCGAKPPGHAWARQPLRTSSANSPGPHPRHSSQSFYRTFQNKTSHVRAVVVG